MKKTKLIQLLLLLFITQQGLFSQIDSIRFKNGQLMIGEIKSMDRGVLKVETDYSDDDFQIEWKQVIWLKTESQFQIANKEGVAFYSPLESLNDSIIRIFHDGNQYTVNIQDIVYLKAYDDGFKDRFSATIDIGFDHAKAKNHKTVNTRSTLGYQAEKWSTDINFNTLQSTQDETDPIRRSDGGLNFRYNLPKKWYLITSLSGLSNTEQKLDIRLNAQQGFGLFFIRTNSAYWGAKLGGNRNIERYSNDTPDRDSWEGYLGTELNLYDIGDLSLTVSIMAYQGLTDFSRFRSDGNFDLKYDLPFDLYLRMGISANYDNQPADDASEFDYVFQTGFGWEW